MAPQDVAREGYEALMNGELFVVTGAKNKAMVAARRILPVTTQARLNKKQHEEVPPEDRTHYRGEKENEANVRR
jgi:short-subunit dehydrogenase